MSECSEFILGVQKSAKRFVWSPLKRVSWELKFSTGIFMGGSKMGNLLWSFEVEGSGNPHIQTGQLDPQVACALCEFPLQVQLLFEAAPQIFSCL